MPRLFGRAATAVDKVAALLNSLVRHTEGQLNLGWAVGGAIAGLLVGFVLRRVVLAYSRPLPTVVELATAAALALLAGRFAGRPELMAFCFVAMLGITLAAIDASTQRLPDRLTLPGYPVLLILLGIAAALRHDAWPLLGAVIGSASLAVTFLALALLRPADMGGGDIKLAGLLGLALGWLGWRTLVAGTALGFALAAVAGISLLIARRATLRTAISFGPFLVSGALLAIVAAGGGG